LARIGFSLLDWNGNCEFGRKAVNGKETMQNAAIRIIRAYGSIPWRQEGAWNGN
jgi:hypothetical protein